MTELHSRPAPHPAAAPCTTPACGSIALERNLYFTGKLLTARDFRDETAYLRSRVHLHNRLFVGTGVVCGLKVVEHDVEECRSRWVIVRAGLAIDCCGREVVLPEDTRLPILEDDWGGDAGDETREFVVCIRYREQEIECVPVLDDSCACTNPGFHPSRVRELGELDVRPLDDSYPDGCWPRLATDSECSDCDDDEPEADCLTTECTCGNCVPIAVVVVHRCAPIEIKDDPPPGPRRPGTGLTHIVDYSWTHGGDLAVEELVDDALWVKFDRQLARTTSADQGVDINPNTFVVQYVQAQASLEYLDPVPGYPRLEDDGCTAVFRIPEARLRPQGGYARSELASGTWVLVALRCDFLLDCRGRPVDGNHLGGRTPTGDGVPGGTFESWFTLVRKGGSF